MKLEIEYTDTFGGEANYSWVKRQEITVPDNTSEREISRRAKLAIGLTGVKCRREEIGEMVALYPQGCCTVLFINPVY